MRARQNQADRLVEFDRDIPPQNTGFLWEASEKNHMRSFQISFCCENPKRLCYGAGRGVYLVQNHDDLLSYCNLSTVAYIQEYLPSDRDMRIVIIGKEVVHAYWRIAPKGEFRSNVAVGATISLDPVPQKALDLAFDTARKCQWDDVGIDIVEHDGKLYVLEANMKYGREGFRQAGIDYTKLMENMIEERRI